MDTKDMLVTGILGGEDVSLRLENYNYFPGRLCCYNKSADGNTYLYGFGNADIQHVWRKVETGQIFTSQIDIKTVVSTYRVYKVFSSNLVDDLIFVLTIDSALSQYHLLRSTNGGVNLSNVLTFGAGNAAAGADSINVRLLEGFCEIQREYPGGGGVGDIYLGEYNVNASRTSGSTNDRVRLLKSVDAGETWSVVMNWNTSGHQIRHIHNIKQDPYTGYVYILTGDTNAESGIIRWDGAAEWTDNASFATINGTSGFKTISGAQRYRATCPLFTIDAALFFADCAVATDATGAEHGIWKASKDLSTYDRVNNDISTYDPNHVGWTGVNINGLLIYTTAKETGYTQKDTQIYISSNGGATWKARGVIGLPTTDVTVARSALSVFACNNRLYVDNQGQDILGTDVYDIVLMVSKQATTKLHPIGYVGTWNAAGSDANDGKSPDAPCETLAGLLAKGTFTTGARIRIKNNPDYIVP